MQKDITVATTPIHKATYDAFAHPLKSAPKINGITEVPKNCPKQQTVMPRATANECNLG